MSKKKLAEFTPLIIPELNTALAHLTLQGKLAVTPTSYCYLNIDDNFIHKIYPLLPFTAITKPDYFSANKNFIGAHISVIYENELSNVKLSQLSKHINQHHSFEINGVVTMLLMGIRYYALHVKAPSLTQIRQDMNLPTLLCYKNNWVDFHITLAKNKD